MVAMETSVTNAKSLLFDFMDPPFLSHAAEYPGYANAVITLESY
jgi:hypothetical protein